jgi:pimeloyl-ACP methyl ester carboxylesterase
VLANRNDDEVMEYARWHVRLTDLGTYAWKMDPAVRTFTPPPVPQPDPWESFKAITCPVLVIRGSTSDVLSSDILARMREARPGTDSVEVPGVGHAPSLMEPEARKALERFLAS